MRRIYLEKTRENKLSHVVISVSFFVFFFWNKGICLVIVFEVKDQISDKILLQFCILKNHLRILGGTAKEIWGEHHG